VRKMEFDWYSEMIDTDEITQGDIIFKCPIVLPNQETFEAIISEKTEADEPLDIKEADVIVLSQACDILNEKIDSLVVCPVVGLKELIAANPYFAGKEARESLRQGKEPPYHLLNTYSKTGFIFPYSVVSFHHIFSLPKDFLKKAALKCGRRIRVLPPYREHLSQAFARYFMRVGLPLDIDKNAIKDFN
jgi:hypothetical protein